MRARSNAWVLPLLLVLLMFGCGSMALMGLVVTHAPRSAQAETIVVIPVHGTIVYGSGSGSGTVYSENLIAAFQEASDSPTVGAIILDINSPGGSVVASVDIYNAVRSSPKLVIASMGEVAASGGYYIACAADGIMARPATLTGSIGVISQFTNIQQLAQTLGIQQQTLKTGPHKDQGSLFRPLDEEEVAMYQAILDQAYDDFVQVIVESRELSEGHVRELADGRVFTGRQAIDVGLVDMEGTLDDAIALAADILEIEGDPHVVRIEQTPSFWQRLLERLPGAAMSPEERLLDLLAQGDGRPTLQYLYTGR